MIERFGLALLSLTLAQALPPALVMRQPLAHDYPSYFSSQCRHAGHPSDQTMNVDIYNYWHYAITGTVVRL